MFKDTVFQKKTTLNAGGRLIDLSHPKVMGIINLTPDSFYASSRRQIMEDVLHQAEKMLNDGASFLDLGAYSSRPGASDIFEEEEAIRLIPVVEAIASKFPEAVISVDTFRAGIAESAVNAGAHIINDISGGELDKHMFETVARLQVPYILMHMKGTPQTMKDLAVYDDVFTEVFTYLEKKHYQLKNLGVHDVVIDPGFGFAKTAGHSFTLLNRLRDFEMLGLPILAGISRKRMIYGTLDIPVEDALNGTTVANTIALMNGASILRVHDVKQAVEAVKIFEAVKT
ncbi:dihydropteroate synthase [Mucilaginibacter ginkgonis]|uniref:dihydropteroate synthase n=1 Tax=Mucilaginibacter ginkgonis TaxID=2682091 RepID=A0A6I4IND0_9SPHI|nr:dihydropteroate synthase [Mucilaginibacter ginkgonis]QQL49300.1 dihydropteroate synthase [Mucilaginibacter ginkgonis]